MPFPLVAVAAGALLSAVGLEVRRYITQSFVTGSGGSRGDVIPINKIPIEQPQDEEVPTQNTFDKSQYDVSINRTYIINIGSPGKSIEIPSLRLPLEADKGKGIKTARGKSIDIKKSVYEHKFGKLLHKPITNKKLTVYEFESKDIEKDFDNYQAQNTTRLAEYLSNRDVKGKLLQLPMKLEELGVLLLPENLRGLSGEIGYVFGHEPLSVINRNFTGRSTTAYMPLRKNVYKEYKKIKKTLKSVTVTKQPKEGDESGLSLASIGLIWDWLGIDNLYRVQDGQLIIDQLLTKFGNVNLLQNKTTKVKGRNQEGVGYEPKAWRFDSLLDYFTSLIAVVFWKIGLNDFPVNVPRNLAELPTLDKIQGERQLDKDARKNDELNLYFDEGKDINIDEKLSEEIKEKYYKDIYSLGEFQTWHIRQLDALFGSFPIEIDIEDTDLIKVGDQGLKVTFPNLAETVSEMVSMGIEQKALINALMEISLRALQETGSDKVLNTKSFYLLESIIDYLGFKTRKIGKEIQFVYNPIYQSEKEEEEKLSEALEPQKVKVDIEEYDDDQSLENHMTALIESARIVKASLWRSVKTKDKKGLKDLFLDAGKVLLGEEEKSSKEAGKKDEFDTFLEEVEKGFVDEPGVTDKTNPYGRVYDRRPKIREVGKDGKD